MYCKEIPYTEAPPPQIPTIPLLPLPPSIMATNRPSSVNRSTVPEEEPDQQLHQCPVVHQPSLHTALIPVESKLKAIQIEPGFALVANILWQIWRMRNNFIFRNQLPDSSLAIQTAIALTSTYQISSATSRQSFGLPSLRSNSTLASSRDGYPQMQYWWKL